MYVYHSCIPVKHISTHLLEEKEIKNSYSYKKVCNKKHIHEI